ncbi:monocarboxylate transporter 14-like [Dermacentor albipictus]|uniref:monocarboxylate transporter 14-like n=1 Tax=Dermacentor albipictus TaxID=60249 RepID=UPI0038FBF1E6
MAPPKASLSKNSALPVAMDCCWSVPLLCACASLLFTMPEANAGLLYVLFMEKFLVSREIASWPRTIATLMTNFMGFAIGAIQQKVAVYTMLLFGSVLCPAAIIASAFVPNMTWMMVTLGCLYGLSTGTLLIGTSVYVVSYFDEYRGAATGIKYLGLSMSGVLGPVLLPTLAATYGLQGLLLVVGGITLNVIPLVLLLRKPQPTKLLLRCLTRTVQSSNSSELKELGSSGLATIQIGSEHEEPQSAGAGKTGSQHATSLHKQKECGTLPGLKYGSELPASNTIAPKIEVGFHIETGILTQIINVLRTPMFYLLLVPIVFADFTLPLFASTIVDYARDKGVYIDKAALLVTCMCIGGFCGRIAIPVVSDKVTNGRCIIAAISFLLLSVCFVLLPHVDVFPGVAAVTFVTGLQQGYLATIKTVLAADYMGVRNVALCWGLFGIASLPLTFFEPSIVGVFRDTGGSYDNLYRLCGGLDLIAALLLLMQAFVQAKKKEASNGGNCQG